jgi:hypothetical protein
VEQATWNADGDSPPCLAHDEKEAASRPSGAYERSGGGWLAAEWAGLFPVVEKLGAARAVGDATAAQAATEAFVCGVQAWHGKLYSRCLRTQMSRSFAALAKEEQVEQQDTSCAAGASAEEGSLASVSDSGSRGQREGTKSCFVHEFMQSAVWAEASQASFVSAVDVTTSQTVAGRPELVRKLRP